MQCTVQTSLALIAHRYRHPFKASGSVSTGLGGTSSGVQQYGEAANTKEVLQWHQFHSKITNRVTGSVGYEWEDTVARVYAEGN